jgi:hypothetical protein
VAGSGGIIDRSGPHGYSGQVAARETGEVVAGVVFSDWRARGYFFCHFYF